MQPDPYTEKKSLWLDDKLNPTEIVELQHHLAGCPTCQRLHQAMLQVHDLLYNAAAYLVEPTPGFSSRFETRLAHHQAQWTWRTWLGLSVLLLGTLLFFAVGAVLGWLSLVGVSSALFDVSVLLYGLGFVGATVNLLRTWLNLGGLGLEVALLTMRQPLFWVFVLVAIGLAALWVRLMQSLYRRVPTTVQLFI